MSWLSKQWVNWIRFTPLGWANLPGLAANIATSQWKKRGNSVDSSSGGFFKEVGDNLGSILKQLLTGDSAENLLKWLTHSGQTDESKETMANQLANQQILNSEEYQRKIDFYNMYESPAAMVRQYQEAGLNPMMLAGSGAGASASGGIGSAGSADAVGAGAGNLLGAISAIANLSLQQKQLEIAAQDADTRSYDAQTRRNQSIDYMAYLRSLTSKTDTETKQMTELFPLKKENLFQQTEYLKSLMDSESVRQRLMESGIDVNEAQEALMLRQEAILAAQEKFSERYFKATAQLQEYYAQIAKTQSEFEQKTLQNRIDSVEYQMYNMLYEAALSSKAFANFTPAQTREWIKTITQVVGTLGGLAVGAGVAGGLKRGVYTPLSNSMNFSGDPYNSGYGSQYGNWNW